MKKLTDEVDTRPLLEHLKSGSNKDTAKVTAWTVAFKAVEPALARNLKLILVVGLNLCQFGLDKRRLCRLASDAYKRLDSCLELAFLDVVTRRLREQEQTETQDTRPDELETNRSTIRTWAGFVSRSITHTSRDKNTDSDGPLIG